jgi:DNA-binding IclR family transcriptional regulator
MTVARAVRARREAGNDADQPASANYHAHALARGLALLELLARGSQPMTLTDFHQRTKMPKSTLVRLLAVLTEAEFVVRVDERPAFRLGHKVLALSTAYVSSLDVSATAGHYLADLAHQSGHTANFGVLDGDQVLHLCVQEPDRPIRFTAMAGSRSSAYCTGLGKLLLAHLPADALDAHLPPEPYPSRTESTLTSFDLLMRDLGRVRRRGYAFDDNEWSAGLRCIAVPLEIDGECRSAISIAGPAAEFTNDRHPHYLEILHETAADMVADKDLVAVLRITYRSLSPSSANRRETEGSTG